MYKSLNNCQFNHQQSSGRSMIEMLGVLAVSGVMAVGGVQGYTKLMTQYRINKTIEQVSMISAKISAAGSEIATYSGLDNNAAIKLRAVPPESQSGSSSALENPFGGSITISKSFLVSSGDDQAYTIQYNGIPEDACLALASHDWGNGGSFIGMGATNSSNLSTVTTNLKQDCNGIKSNNYAIACSNGTTLSVPMDVSSASNACNCGNSCILIFKYF